MTDMTRFRSLLIGLGQMGCGYDAGLKFEPEIPRSSTKTYTHARALACHPGFDLEAGIDPNPEARRRFKELWQTPADPETGSQSQSNLIQIWL